MEEEIRPKKEPFWIWWLRLKNQVVVSSSPALRQKSQLSKSFSLLPTYLTRLLWRKEEEGGGGDMFAAWSCL